MKPTDWMQGDEAPYLPPFLRDFHDAKEFFKTLDGYFKPSEALKNHTWVSNQIFTVDFFLWFCGIHGYTLQKCRKKGVEFKDIHETLKAAYEARRQAMSFLFEQPQPQAEAAPQGNPGTGGGGQVEAIEGIIWDLQAELHHLEEGDEEAAAEAVRKAAEKISGEGPLPAVAGAGAPTEPALADALWVADRLEEMAADGEGLRIQKSAIQGAVTLIRNLAKALDHLRPQKEGASGEEWKGCGRCDRPYGGPTPSDAALEFWGWRKLTGVWVCPICTGIGFQGEGAAGPGRAEG